MKVWDGIRLFDPKMDVNCIDAVIVTNLPAIAPLEQVVPQDTLDPQITAPPDAGVGQ